MCIRDSVWWGAGEIEFLPFPEGTIESYVNDINDQGVIVGCARIADSGFSTHASGTTR